MISGKWLDTSYLARYVLLNSVDVTDYIRFPYREIRNAPPVFHFSLATDDLDLREFDEKGRSSQILAPNETLDEFLQRNGTTAFLLIQQDRLLIERYYHGYEHSAVCTSFSTAKSFVSAMVGIAIDEGLIHQLDDPIIKYLPELTGPHWPAITIRHLLSMSSGLGYKERGFLPWDDAPRIYYSPNIRQLARRARSTEPPGLHFHYNNYNLVLLGMLLERITGGSVSAYLEEKIWRPLGMEYPASWSLDSRQSGMEKMESGLNARAIDYAKFGRLYLRLGDWNGYQVVPERWVAESTTADPEAKWTNYKYLWWIPSRGKGRFMAAGNLGQFIYVAPDKDCIILRFGRGRPRDWQRSYPVLFGTIADLL